MSQFDQVRGQGGKSHKDELSSFQFETPRTLGRFRPFIRRSKFRAMGKGLSQSTSRDGMNSSLTGSSKNLLDPSKMMNLQEDAKSRRISSEVMKHRLYDSVVSSPRRRRMSSSLHTSGYYDDCTDYHNMSLPNYYMPPGGRMAMSMPATPATSQRTTPAHSPTQNRKFMFGFFSRGNTPYGNTPEDELMDIDMCEQEDGMVDNSQGLASIFSPKPKYIPGARWVPRLDKDESPKRPSIGDGSGLGEEIIGGGGDLVLQDVPKAKQGRKMSKSPEPE